ncbi:hypothetical protein [Metamycoplasma gateae]|uniref:Uncharacterized protein n=1 Tax=Metamycoplasma gateae TaxID=35769 RepID=A0ABZ2AG53_9BACT|nr:hypothetical protein V2E26_01725 [Metamycoplasma gateae]
MAKSTLEKFYISEKFDENRNVSFNFKKANQKISGNFKEFIDAVLEFIRVSEKTKNDTRVWFHQNGAYRGSVNIAKARVIVEKIKAESVKSEEAIEFIEKAELVDKPAPAKKQAVKKTVVNLDNEASKTTFFVEDAANKKASQVSALDVKSQSKYATVIEKVSQLENTVVITYHLEHEGKTSKSYEYVITGFASSCTACPCSSTKKTSSLFGTTRRDKRIFWILFTILTVLIVANVILISLRLTHNI